MKTKLLRQALATICLATGFMSGIGAAHANVSYSNSVPVDIADEGTAVSSIDVLSHGRVLDLDLLIGKLTHGWDADLILSLSHGGTTVVLSNRNGGSGGADYIDTVFDDAAAMAINDGAAYAPYTGSFRPEQALAAFNDQDIFGLWTLSVADMEAGDAGVLNQWGISAAVPEPGTVSLVALGLAGMFVGRRRAAGKR